MGYHNPFISRVAGGFWGLNSQNAFASNEHGSNRMKTVRKIISGLVVAAIIAGGLPLFSPEDANRDNSVDLRDAILHMRALAQTADGTGVFPEAMVQTLSSMSALAGLNTVIKGDNPPGSHIPPPGLDSPFLIAVLNGINISTFRSIVFSTNPSYQSVTLVQPTPPPQYFFIS